MGQHLHTAFASVHPGREAQATAADQALKVSPVAPVTGRAAKAIVEADDAFRALMAGTNGLNPLDWASRRGIAYAAQAGVLTHHVQQMAADLAAYGPPDWFDASHLVEEVQYEGLTLHVVMDYTDSELPVYVATYVNGADITALFDGAQEWKLAELANCQIATRAANELANGGPL